MGVKAQRWRRRHRDKGTEMGMTTEMGVKEGTEIGAKAHR